MEVSLAEERIVFDWTFHRQPFVLVSADLDEVDQRQSLTVAVTINQQLMSRIRNDRSGDGARCRPDRIAQGSARQVFADALKGKKEECLVLANGPTNRAAKLLAAKICEWFAIGGVRRQRFKTLKEKQTTVQIVGA